ATDFSPVALDYVRKNLEALGEKSASVTLLERRAEDFEGIEARSFDVVILNSTVQYFPGVSYLLDVLDGAARAVRDGGHVFVGDVRHHGLMEAFHTEVQLHQMGTSSAAAKLRDRVRQEISREQELLVAPELFRALRKRVPRAAEVWVSPKRGRHPNELTQFRYDAIVRMGGERRDVVSAHWEDWRESGMTLSRLGEWLSKGGFSRPRGFARVPNLRVERSVSVSTSTEPRPGVDPEDLWQLEEKYPCRVELSWLSGREDGSFDVVFAPKSAGPLWFPEPGELEDKPWSEYGNDPLAGSQTRGLVPRLREHLGEKLPEYMVPSAFVVISDLPLNTNGKVDRAKLPSPESARPELANDYVAPRGPVEEGVAGIWGGVLGVSRVGAHDDFFDLGGHSLLATQVMSRVRLAFQVEVPLKSLFELPTVAGLSGRIEDLRRRGASIAAPPITKRERPNALPLSFAQQRLWFLDRLRPGNTGYSSFRALRLRGELDEPAMKRAFAEVLRRHE
ncbi:MAG: phosphopantetheine-binding protein, partial [Vicinamibacteria bacterium]